MSFTTRTLGELCKGKGSYGLGEPAIEYDSRSYRYIRISDISDDGFLSAADLKSVASDKLDEYLLKKNDIVFARTGNSTGRNYFFSGDEGKCVYAGFLIKFSIDEKLVNPLYVKYYCKSPMYRSWVKSVITGSTRGNINANTFAQLPIQLPPRENQDSIVAILDSIEKKMLINRALNDNLVQQAENIFAHEFLMLDVIPDGWKKSSLLGIAKYLNGLAMQKYRPNDDEQGLPVLKIRELRQGFCDANSELCSPSIESEYIIHDGDVIFSWSGSLLVDLWCGGICGLNQHLFKVTSSTYDKWFYFSWTNHHLQKFAAIAADMATTMGHIKREELEKAEVLIPSQSDYDRIGGLLAPLYDLIITNRIENRKIASLRDELLPKLLSGELDVLEASL